MSLVRAVIHGADLCLPAFSGSFGVWKRMSSSLLGYYSLSPSSTTLLSFFLRFLGAGSGMLKGSCRFIANW